jgi:hypothetical protein
LIYLISESWTGPKYDAHSDPIFKELKILNFEQIHLLQLGLFMFLFKKFLLPEKCKSMFIHWMINCILIIPDPLSKFHLPLCASNIRKVFSSISGLIL